MDRTSAAGYADIGGGKRGYRDRNLVGGIAGTALVAADKNAVQEEMLHIIEEAGLTPNASDWTQVLAALKQILGGRGALLTLSSNFGLPNNTETAITWPTPIWQTDNVWSGGTPGRVTVPAGVTRVRISAQVTFANNATGSRKMRILKNGAIEGTGLPAMRLPTAGSTDVTILNAAGGIVPVTAGDYLELRATQDAGGFLDALPFNTWFSFEILK